MRKIVVKLNLIDDKDKGKALKTVSSLSGIDSIAMDMKEMKLTVVGVVDPIDLVTKLRKYRHAEILSIGPLAKEGEKKEGGGGEGGGEEEKKKFQNEQITELVRAYQGLLMPARYVIHSEKEFTHKIVVKLDLHDNKDKRNALKTISSLSGIDSIAMDMKKMQLTVVGVVDPIDVVTKLRKYWPAVILSVGPLAKEGDKKEGGGGGGGGGGGEGSGGVLKEEGGDNGGCGCREEKKDPNEQRTELVRAYQAYNPY